MSDTRKIPPDKDEGSSAVTASSKSATSGTTLENPRDDPDVNELDGGSDRRVDGGFESPDTQQSSTASLPRGQNRGRLDQEDFDCRPLRPSERKPGSSKRHQSPSSSSSQKQKTTASSSSSTTKNVAPTRLGKSSFSSPNNGRKKKARVTARPATKSSTDGVGHDRGNNNDDGYSNIDSHNRTTDAYHDDDDYSLSTAPAPPSLRIRPHYSLRPGAYRMTGGVARYVSADSDDDTDNYSYHNTVNTTSALDSGSVDDEQPPLPPSYRPTTREDHSVSDQRYSESTRTENPNSRVLPEPRRDRFGRIVDNGTRVEASSVAVDAVSIVEKDDGNSIISFNRMKVLIMIGILILIVALASICGVYAQKRFRSTGEPDDTIQAGNDYQSPSLPPSTSSTESLLESFVKRLPYFTKESLQIRNSPQSKAIQWMSTYDDIGKYPPPRQSQRFALVTLYFSIAAQEPTHEILTFLAGVDECYWFGSTCVENMYMELFLESSTAWRGTIVPELSLLSSLESLRIDPNDLVGVIPTELGQITTLKEILIKSNLLRGTIPTELGKLSDLERVALSSNLLSGSIPVEIGSWSKVQTLILAENNFEGTIPPEIGRMSNLIEFSASSNQLKGELPSEIGHLKKIERFNVRRNFLSGEALSKFENHGHSLQNLYLNSNEFTGTIASTIGLLTNLVEFDGSKNKLEGAIPTEIGLMTRLTRLQLFSNSLQYNVPKELGRLTSLRNMELYNNQFTGSVPFEICRTTSFLSPKEFIIDCNQLLCACCTCPPE